MSLIVSWNVNSVKARLEHLISMLKEYSPAVVLLQEIKCENSKFPTEALEDLGYNIAIHGQKSYHGVAVLSKTPIEDKFTALTSEEEFSDEARYLEVLTYIGTQGVRVASVYVPNGTQVGAKKFFYKLRFFEALDLRFRELAKLGESVVVGGDYNVAPEDIDVYDPKHLDGTLGFHIEERKRFRAILNGGMYDSFRLHHPQAQEYSWWDYRGNGWQYNKGMRIDHVCVSANFVDRISGAGILAKFRGLEKASDHVPVYCVVE